MFEADKEKKMESIFINFSREKKTFLIEIGFEKILFLPDRSSFCPKFKTFRSRAFWWLKMKKPIFKKLRIQSISNLVALISPSLIFGLPIGLLWLLSIFYLLLLLFWWHVRTRFIVAFPGLFPLSIRYVLRRSRRRLIWAASFIHSFRLGYFGLSEQALYLVTVNHFSNTISDWFSLPVWYIVVRR